MKTLVLSFSGGRTSAYMTKLMLEKYSGKREIIVLFANTGKEREETLEFVHECDLQLGFNTVWLESTQYHNERKSSGFIITSYEKASRNGEPFEDMIIKFGLPNMSFPHCTRELKTNPIYSYLKELKIEDYEMAIGIRIDEPKRIKPKPNIIYPLVKEFPTTKLMVNKWWFNQSFNLNLKDYEGNCDLCWKKSKRKHLTLLLEHPEYADWWNDMEIKYGQYVPETQKACRTLPITFFRKRNRPSSYWLIIVQDLIEDTQHPFEIQKDAFTIDQLLFSAPELDFTDGCEESCEAF